ncbi:MAG: HAMP domain-containing histidine kinase [Streptococcaceae bacterium]|jgi:two-component system sensor histidine kinase CiaH|nr:HAMP domain-containing histidine kinase [Streptococcaceae bacterium]
MNGWRRKINKFLASIDAKFFLRYLLAFALIFTTLAFIVIQILVQTSYSSIDKNLERLANDPRTLYQMLNTDGTNSLSPAGQIDMTIQIVFWDKNGQLLISSNQIGHPTLSQGLKFSQADVNSVINLSLKNQFNQVSEFRSLTKKIKVVGTTGETEVAYVQIMANTNQVSASVKHFKGIILYTMVAFWLISIVISWFLTKMSMRPIIKNWEKQRAFVSNASHELRTPLAILQNRLERLFQKPESTIMENSENIADSLNEVRNMRFLTSSLLSLAKEDRKQLDLNPEWIERSFFDKLAASYSELARLGGKKFVAEISDVQNFKQDQQILKQLVTILFDNALKYTGDDGLIELIVVQNKKDIIISVKDNGLGISENDKVKVFERFYRVDKARTRTNGGLGLGLSLLKQLIDILKGKVEVYDNFPRGTAFKLTIPNESGTRS